MKENLLQVAEYIESLEKRLSALEERVADQAEQIADYESRIAELEARPYEEDDYDEWEEEEVIEEEPIPEEPVVEEPIAEEEPTVEEVPTEEVVEEKPVPEGPKPVEEPKPVPRPAEPQPVPQQATLFGNTVADLKHAISLGDRFLFQRELFAQNGELMQKTIEALNKQNSFDAAAAYLDKHFADWDKDSSAYTLFINALHRRFG